MKKLDPKLTLVVCSLRLSAQTPKQAKLTIGKLFRSLDHLMDHSGTDARIECDAG
ncbi:MAG: hypothetical protein LT106_12990 [Burkholderiaceae bacterium]|nr:hypothetical protein [Burkholderiaceae bacterium]